jgi:hypothetical protein
MCNTRGRRRETYIDFTARQLHSRLVLLNTATATLYPCNTTCVPQVDGNPQSLTWSNISYYVRYEWTYGGGRGKSIITNWNAFRHKYSTTWNIVKGQLFLDGIKIIDVADCKMPVDEYDDYVSISFCPLARNGWGSIRLCHADRRVDRDQFNFRFSVRANVSELFCVT